MALLFLDSFDHYQTADIAAKYLLAGAPSIQAAGGRRGGGCLRMFSSSSSCQVTLSPADPTTVVLGIAVKGIAFANGDSLIRVMNAAGVQQCNVSINASGFVEVKRVSTVLATAVISPLTAGAFSYIEAKIVIHPSAGSAIVRVNETQVINVTSVNTANTGAANWGSLYLTGNASGNNTDYDDLYVLDGSGAAPLNDFLGDCRVDARYPTAEGASSAWTPLSGTDNALMVDDPTPDGDATYNSTTTVGATDTHVVQDAPVPGAVLYGVQIVLSQKKSDAGTCSVAPVVRHSGVDYPGSAVNPGTAYAYAVTPYGVNPGTGAAWTEAGFNAAEFGYKRTA